MLVAQRYRLDELIGRGGMGQVWRAVDEVLGRDVAVKLLNPGSASEVAAERFRLEAQAAGRISDPHVVAVYDFGVDDDRLFLVMELIDGCSLADELHRYGSMRPERAAGLIAQTARGLSSAHGHGVVHRDIKPANLLLATHDAHKPAAADYDDRIDPVTGGTGIAAAGVVDADYLVKIADFGIARIADSAAALTATGQIAGTSHYLAPERVIGEPGGPAADVYSLGCVGYHLVTGRPPFHGDAPAAIAFQHVHGEPVPPRDLCPQVTGHLEDMLLRMLAKDPAQRPSAREVAQWTTTTPAAEAAQQSASRPLLVAGSRRGASPAVGAGKLPPEVESSGHGAQGDTSNDTQPLDPTFKGSPARNRRTKRAAFATVATAAVVGGAMTWTTLHADTEAERPKPNAPSQTTTSPSSRPSTQPTTDTSSQLPATAGRPTSKTSAAAEPSTSPTEPSEPSGTPTTSPTPTTSRASSRTQPNPTTPEPSPTAQNTPTDTTPVPATSPVPAEPTTPPVTPP